MTGNSAATRPTYAAVCELIKLHFWKLLRVQVVFSLVYLALIAALGLLFGLIDFVADQFVPVNVLSFWITFVIVQVLAYMITVAMLYSALSSSVLKVYRCQDRVSTVDNAILIKMFSLIILVCFLNFAVAIAGTGIASVLADFSEYQDDVRAAGNVITFVACSLLTLTFLFAPFFIVDGASFSEALDGSFKLLTRNFFWLIPILLAVVATHCVFNFGFTILGVVYFLGRSEMVQNAADSSAPLNVTAAAAAS